MKNCFRCLALFMALAMLVLCSGCLDFLKGSTETLDVNSLDTLLATYNEKLAEFNKKGEKQKKPTVQAQVLVDNYKDLYYLTVRFLNNSDQFSLTVNGYAHFTQGPKATSTSKLIFFNQETNVANSTYKSIIPFGKYSADVIYEVQEPTVTITTDTIVFVFFSMDEIEYVGAATCAASPFFYWELPQSAE